MVFTRENQAVDRSAHALIFHIQACGTGGSTQGPANLIAGMLVASSRQQSLEHASYVSRLQSVSACNFALSLAMYMPAALKLKRMDGSGCGAVLRHRWNFGSAGAPRCIVQGRQGSSSLEPFRD